VIAARNVLTWGGPLVTGRQECVLLIA
jgi:hypothetical protein